MALTSVIDSANKVPGSFIQVSLGVGPQSAGSAPRRLLLYGNKLSSAPMPLETAETVLTEEDAITRAGQGSELHRMVRAALRVNRTVDLSMTAIAESAGAAATIVATFAVGPATASGTVEIFVSGDRVVAAIAIGDTVTVVGDAVELAINDEPDFPVTAANVAGVVTLTARQLGPRGNFIRVRTLLTGGTGVTHTSLGAYMAGGTTSDDPQTAIDNAQPVRYHYHVAPYELLVELTKFRTHVESDATPIIGQRETFIAASRDTLANTTTLATGLNASRGQVCWLFNAEDEPSIIAAAEAALRAKDEGADAASNHDGKVLTRLHVPVLEADFPVNSELVSALNNGITPLRPINGAIQIVRTITTKSQVAGGGAPDFGVLDTHKVIVPDFVADDLDLNWLRFEGFKAKDDDPTGDPPDPGVLTPAIVKDFIYERLKEAEESNLIVDVDARIDEIVVQLSTITDGRFDAVIPTDVIELAHQFAADVRQIG